MKQLLVIMIALLGLTVMSGCGLQNQINDLKGRADHDETDIGDLKKRVAVLESQMSSAQNQLVVLGDSLNSQGSNLNGQVATINAALAALSQADANQQTQINTINASIISTNAQIAALQSTDVNYQAQLTALNAQLVAQNASLNATITSGNASLQSQINTLNTQVTNALSDASVLAGRVSAVEGDTALLDISVGNLQTDLASTNSLVANYASLGTAAYNQIQSQIASLQSSSVSVNTNVTVLQASVNSALVQIATLQGYQNIVSIKDPCGAQGSYNEVFLKLSTGKYLASFSDNANGLNTRFSVLTDGNFVTTDGSHCYFTVSSGGTVISNEHN